MGTEQVSVTACVCTVGIYTSVETFMPHTYYLIISR